MQLVIESGGRVRCVYGEEFSLETLGQMTVTRASHVEPDSTARWFTDLSPVGGPHLGPFERRSQALYAELRWLEENILSHSSPEA